MGLDLAGQLLRDGGKARLVCRWLQTRGVLGVAWPHSTLWWDILHLSLQWDYLPSQAEWDRKQNPKGIVSKIDCCAEQG